MFRCQMCETVCPPRTRTSRIVVKTRRKEYASRGPDPSERRRGGFRRGRRPNKKKYDKGGEGHETVRELVVCPTCAAKFTDPEPVENPLLDAPVLDAPVVETPAEPAATEAPASE